MGRGGGFDALKPWKVLTFSDVICYLFDSYTCLFYEGYRPKIVSRPWLVRVKTIEVLFSNGDALATQNGIGRGDMKEEVG